MLSAAGDLRCLPLLQSVLLAWQEACRSVLASPARGSTQQNARTSSLSTGTGIPKRSARFLRRSISTFRSRSSPSPPMPPPLPPPSFAPSLPLLAPAAGLSAGTGMPKRAARSRAFSASLTAAGAAAAAGASASAPAAAGAAAAASPATGAAASSAGAVAVASVACRKGGQQQATAL
jgi:hypothetical protein